MGSQMINCFGCCSEKRNIFLNITVNTINGRKNDAVVPVSITGGQLKSLIYQNFCQSLEVNQMSIIYEGSVIENNKKLSDLRLLTEKSVVISQDKISLAEIPKIIVNTEGIDAINNEKGVTKMCCGHWVSRGTLTSYLESIISLQQFEIRCPFPDKNRLICSALWQFKDCKKIGTFTKEELGWFESGLSMNWINKFTKKCPNCRTHLFKGDIQTDRVSCPKCRINFCYLCLNSWIGGPNGRCGNQDCLIPQDLLKKSPFNRVFQLSVNGAIQKVNTPKFRACIYCKEILENYINCKHTTCKTCQKIFCWVCLGAPVNGNWPCGDSNNYCGKVALVQTL